MLNGPQYPPAPSAVGSSGCRALSLGLFPGQPQFLIPGCFAGREPTKHGQTSCSGAESCMGDRLLRTPHELKVKLHLQALLLLPVLFPAVEACICYLLDSQCAVSVSVKSGNRCPCFQNPHLWLIILALLLIRSHSLVSHAISQLWYAPTSTCNEYIRLSRTPRISPFPLLVTTFSVWCFGVSCSFIL